MAGKWACTIIQPETDRYGLKGGGGGLIFANNQYATDILCIAKSIVTGSCVLAVPSALAWHYFPAVRVISHIYMSKDGMLQIPLF